MNFVSLITGLAQQSFFIIAGLVGIGFLIGWHELGHFLFCKLFSISTPSFSIGMGPRLITKKIGETEFSLSAIPLGGYVEIAGAAEVGQGEQQQAHRTDQYSFVAKPYYQKLLVMLGGILFNIIFAYAAFSFLYYIGMPKSALFYPKNAITTISSVEPGSPAEKYNLLPDDKIISANDIAISNPETLLTIVKDKPQGSLNLVIERQGKIEKKSITLGEKTIQKTTIGFLGIDFVIPKYPLLTSLKMGVQATHDLIYQVVLSFKNLFTKKALDNLGGPLMVISQTVKGAEKGFKIFLLLLAFISINLAVLNVIPLPIMDGGQILFYSIEALIGKPLPEKIKMYIHYACWIGIVALAIFLSIKDIGRILFPQ